MKRAVVVAGTAVCALVAALGVHLWSTSTDTETSPAGRAVPRPARAPRSGGLAGGAVSASGGALSIRGRVVGPAGPVSGAVVAAFAPVQPSADPLIRALCPEGGGEVYECDGGDEASAALAEAFASRALERPALARATTDTEGRFSLEGLAAGTYDVWAEREGGFASQREQEAPGEDLELTLEPGVLLEGKVEVDGAPPQGALLVSSAEVGFPRIFEAQTGAEGAFSIGPVPAVDRDILSTSLEGYLGAHQVVEAMADERAASNISLELAWPRRLAGVVLDDGRPAAGVKVSVEGSLHDVPDVVSDSEGRFVFASIHPGDYTLKARRPFAMGEEGVTILPGRDPPEVTVELVPVGLVRGVVRDEAGRPVADASVFLAGHEVIHTVADGRFELAGASPTERLMVRADGFLPIDEELKVPPGAPLERDLTLRRAVTLRGKVVDEAGHPIHLATLIVHDETASNGNQASTNQAGAFELEAADARTEVEVAAQGYVTEKRTLSAGVPERIALRTGGSMVVRLVDSDGKPVPDGHVTAVPLRGSAERRTVSAYRPPGSVVGIGSLGKSAGERNEYLLAGLTAGDYRLEVHSGSGLEVRTVHSDGHGRQELEVKLPAMGKISGVVVGSTGAPVPDTYVRATELLEGSRGRSAVGGRTDEHGEFHLVAKRGGRYALFALKDNRAPVTGITATADGAPVKIVLPEPAKVRGRVLYPDGAPAGVFSLNGDRIRAAGGRFEQEVAAGEVSLTLAAPGFAPQALHLDLRAGEERDLGDLSLSAGRTLAVRVVDARTSAPVGGANVHVSGVEVQAGDSGWGASLDEPVRRTRTDGSTALSHVPDHAQLAVEADGYQPATAVVGPGSSEVVRLEPNGTLRVFVDDPFEGPLWVSVEGPEDRTLPLDPRAGAAFAGLPSGDYTVALWRAPPSSGQKWDGTMAPAQPVEISFPLEGPGEVHFRLRAAGTDVTVRLDGVPPDADLQALLVPERVDVAQLMDNPLSIKLEQVVVPERPGQRNPTRFAQVPDGTYRVAALIFGETFRGMYVDPRPLVLHAGGGAREVVVNVPDDWRPESD